MQRRLSPHGEADEGRLERKRNQRPDRQAEPFTVQVDADDGDSRREPPHQFAKLVGANHGGEGTRYYDCLVLPTELVAVENRIELGVHGRFVRDVCRIGRAEVVESVVAPHHVGRDAWA